MERDMTGRTVLLIWSGASPTKDIEDVVGRLRQRVGELGKVNVEHVERLRLSCHPESTFDVICSGMTFPTVFVHNMDILAEIARILKPSGCFNLRQPTGNTGNLVSEEQLISTLKLSGFVNISQANPVNLTKEQIQELLNSLTIKDKVVLTEVSCEKPSFNVGSSSQLSLSFTKKTEAKADDSAAKIWTLSAQDMNDDEVDIMDSDELLDENDLKKPDPESLKSVCGPNSGKKKACKNCTCGLADDLAQGIEGSQPKSACGSCYLGDAFRCASCPYLGMPAFKPGDKISLTDRQLKPDI